MTRTILACIAAGFFLSACDKGEPVTGKARPNAPLQLPGSASAGGDGANQQPDEGLKERLARQEAASKMFDRPKSEQAPEIAKAVPNKPPPEPARPAPEPVKPAPEPVKTAAAAPAPAPVQAPAPAPTKAPPTSAPASTTAAPSTTPAKAAAVPTPAPAKAEPAPAKAESAPATPRTDVAAAKGSSAPFAVPPARVINRVPPDFPREATQQGYDEGFVRARMTLDGNGNVTRVEVIESKPRRVFDRAVVRALSQWQFNEGPSGRTVETEVEFKR